MDKICNPQIEELNNLNQLKDNFLSAVSHELRSPVTNIKMATQMLKLLLQESESNDNAQFLPERPDQTLHKAKVGCYLQILEQECDREINLLNNFLDLQQLDAGNYVFNETTVYLQEFIPQLIQPFLGRVAHQQQTLQLEIAANLSFMEVDQTILGRILTELLTNACKFTPLGGAIAIMLSGDVTSTQSLKTLQLKVTNSGVEISTDNCSQIFERFHRIPNGDRWKYDGIGLGLTLVKKLVEHLRGSIGVDSSTEQTCFTIEIPVNVKN